MDDDDVEATAVLAANQAFYDAFEARDVEALAELWDHEEHVTCVHPGWPVLRGWDQVRASWEAILGGPQRLQFILTDQQARVVGDAAWVTLDENLIDGAGSSGATATALNTFERRDGRWRMVGHHASSVLGPVVIDD